MKPNLLDVPPSTGSFSVTSPIFIGATPTASYSVPSPLTPSPSDPAATPEKGVHRRAGDTHHEPRRGIAVAPVKAGHVVEVHPVHPGDEIERQHHGRDQR